ncbi:MAG: hypothetical protein ABF975_01195 [Liquorilactobacillus hordei]|uniref:DUF6941 family protein n=1 Tax=Liquorilactobacillus hordei TaxID=468911 RepID=UPI0039EC0848
MPNINEPVINISFGEGLNAFGNQSMLINPIVSIHTKYSPSVLSFAVVIVVSNFKNTDSSSPHSLHAKLYSAKNEEDSPLQFINNDQINNIPSSNLRLNWNLNNIDFKEPGEYIVECTFDGTTKKESFFIEADNILKQD